MRLFSRSHLLICVLLVGVLTTSSVFAQQGLKDLFNLNGGAAVDSGDATIKVTLEPAVPKTGETVSIKIDVKIPAGSHTYSTSPDFGGATKIGVTTVAGVEAIDRDFVSNPKPTAKFDPNLQQRVEFFEDRVVWSRQFKVLDAKTFALAGSVSLQVCDDGSCRPLPAVKFAFGSKEALAAAAAPKFSMSHSPTTRSVTGDRPGPITWTVRLSPENAKPGDVVTLEAKALVAKDYHIFALDQDPKNYGKPTVIRLDEANSLEPIHKNAAVFKADRKPEAETVEGKAQRIHRDEVTFTQEFRVTDAAAKSGYGIAGLVSYQFCLEGPSGNCRPDKFEFSLGTVTGKKATAAVVAPQAGSGDNPQALAEFLDGMKARNVETDGSLALFLLYAFLGGMILNVMPCVLPVIAIKALGFVQQAGENRSRILALNAAYSGGIIAVFLLLATFAVTAGLTWGGLFQKVEFNMAMSVLVFAMGLSLLGVFEIPVPGMIGSSAGAQHKEGLSGAFVTGVFATVLATPCSGPFLGTTLGWSVKQSPAVVYLVWGMMGVGMAFPYLVFGLFPKAIKLLPRPGNWMVTFKQIAGFCLLGTTVYLLSLIQQSHLMATIVILLGVGFGLWMIGNLYDYSSLPSRRWFVRVCSLVIAGGISWFGWGLTDNGEKYHWELFTAQAVTQALKDGKPVMIDFTADWCATCKVVERFTLNTDATAAMVELHGFVPFKADKTHESEEIESVLKQLGIDGIPVLAIISPTRPKEPIVLKGGWTQSALMTELETIAQEVQAAKQQARAGAATQPVAVQ